MSPPIRDGSGNDIGAIRLGDGSEIAEVRTGAGDVLFSAAPDTLVDDFNDNINSWNGGNHETNTVKEGNGSLRLFSNGTSNSANSNEGDGLNYYPQEGNVITFWLHMTDTANGSLELVKNGANYIAAGMSPGQSQEFFIRSSTVDSGEQILATQTGVTTDDWYKFNLKTAETIELEVTDVTGSVIGSLSANKPTGFNYGRDINLSINSGNQGNVYLDIIKSTS